MAILSANKLAWAAGFFDGEGCIYVAKSKNDKLRHGIRYEIRITVSQVDVIPLKVLISLFGGSLHKRSKGTKHIYNWYLNGASALKVLEKLLPYLVLKNKEAKIALRFKKLLGYGPGHRIADNIFKQKEVIYRQLQEVKNGRYSR